MALYCQSIWVMEGYTVLTDPDAISDVADRRQVDMSTDANDEGLSATTGLHWSNGIGSLPGSNLKFRKNERGDIEVIMETINLGSTRASHRQDFKKRDSDVDSREFELGEWRQPTESKPEGANREGFIATDTFDDQKALNMTTSVKRNTESTLDSGNYSLHGVNHVNPLSPFNSSTTVNPSPHEPRRKYEKKDSVLPKNDASSPEKVFDWDVYLQTISATPAPIDAFLDVTGREPFPTTEMKFSVGDLLESVDPLHQSLICAVSVVEVKGYRMRLHFEGYATLHDFWVNADEKLIFPCGFCESTGRSLHPPKNFDAATFHWPSYASTTGKSLSGEDKFREDISQCFQRDSLFEIGDKLEAIDKSNPQFTCVATVSDIIDDRILIHFDGWNHNFDYWCDSKSNYIHPTGWCDDNDKALSVPHEYSLEDLFQWSEYLQGTNSRAATSEAFVTRTYHLFEVGMRLEVVDKRNPILVRVASVADKNHYQIKIHFDGWDELYDYWIDVDSPDLHPVKWCEKTGHPLQPNITEEEKTSWHGGCPILGCRGIGHIKGSKFVGHHSEYGCPYSAKNLDSYPIQDRIMPRRGPKPSSLMSRRIANFSGDKEKLNSSTVGDRRRSYQRRESRNSAYDTLGEKGEADSDHSSPSSNCYEPPTKIERHHKEPKVEDIIPITDGSNLKYPVSTATAWSPFPDKHLSQYWDQCSKYIPGMTGIRGSVVSKWTSEDVANFVTRLTGRENYGLLFLNEEIDGEAFLLLTRNDISKVLNIKLGPTLKIHGAILYALAND